MRPWRLSHMGLQTDMRLPWRLLQASAAIRDGPSAIPHPEHELQLARTAAARAQVRPAYYDGEKNG